MKIRFSILFFIVLSFFSFCYGQTPQSGIAVVRIFVLPQDAVIKIDSLRINKNDTTLLLRPGTYKVRIWAPFKEFYESTINISGDTTILLKKVLTPDLEYVDYKKKLKEYKNTKFQRIGFPVIFSMASAGGAFVMNNMAEKFYEQALKDKQNYQMAFYQDDINSYREEYLEHRKKYYYSKTGVILLGVSSGIFLAASIRNMIKYFKNDYPKPEYKVKNLLSRVDFGIKPNTENAFEGYTILKF